jgi:hypothetical protein
MPTHMTAPCMLPLSVRRMHLTTAPGDILPTLAHNRHRRRWPHRAWSLLCLFKLQQPLTIVLVLWVESPESAQPEVCRACGSTRPAALRSSSPPTNLRRHTRPQLRRHACLVSSPPSHHLHFLCLMLHGCLIEMPIILFSVVNIVV